MADAPVPGSGPIKFPASTSSGGATPLVLRRRRGLTHSPFEVSESSSAARDSIRAVVEATRSPFGGGGPSLDKMQATDLERSLRQLEASLADRERVVADIEVKLADRERDLAETEALLLAREQLLAASRKAAPTKAGMSKEEQAALEQLRAELERQETALKEERQGLREREQFLDESESKLFEKVQAQQEKETELEQREEDLRTRSREFREKLAAIDPAAAAALKLETETAKKKSNDEFNE
jgi:chromosome segregation ATPase